MKEFGSAGVGAGGVVGLNSNNHSVWAARSSKFNTPIKPPKILSPLGIDSSSKIIPPEQHNDEMTAAQQLVASQQQQQRAVELKATAANTIMPADVETRVKLEDMNFEFVEKSLDKTDIDRLTIFAQFYSQIILSRFLLFCFERWTTRFSGIYR